VVDKAVDGGWRLEIVGNNSGNSDGKGNGNGDGDGDCNRKRLGAAVSSAIMAK
jgi:hypothetical protein